MKGKHDIYLMYLPEGEIATSEKWIDELQEEYKGALAVYKEYENEKQLIEQKHLFPLYFHHFLLALS